ncbi:MAG: YidC/Oxa1 family membrane protein insertase [Pseudoflavonifractor sp.]|nr:YidC/Oxa1 family membrane protein insertase [Pseudoflavonifractor sp.]
MDFAYYILTPFTWLLMFFYQFFNSYGVALILFALVVKLILYPLSLKGKRSMIQMNMLSGKLQKLQKQYGKDQNRYNEEVQNLYAKEKVNPMGGCLWSALPLAILLPLYAIIRQPLKYMMGLSVDQITTVAKTVDWNTVAVNMGWTTQQLVEKAGNAFSNTGYNQLYLASLITPQNLNSIQAAVGETAKEIFSINFNFFGIELSQVPQLKFWANGISWAALGLFLIPVISGVTSLIFSLISTKTNNMNQQQPQDSQAAKTTRTMMIISPVISLWIGFSMPAALSVYWVANNLLGMIQEFISSKVLKKDYEKAAQLQRERELEEKEEEKRQRREKAEERARQAEEARKNKNKKKEKDEEEEKISPSVREASRVGIRQYARGRAYDPERYGGVTPYHEDVAAGIMKKIEELPEQQTPADIPAPEDETAVDNTVEEAAESVAETDRSPEEDTPKEDTPKED